MPCSATHRSRGREVTPFPGSLGDADTIGLDARARFHRPVRAERVARRRDEGALARGSGLGARRVAGRVRRDRRRNRSHDRRDHLCRRIERRDRSHPVSFRRRSIHHGPGCPLRGRGRRCPPDRADPHASRGRAGTEAGSGAVGQGRRTAPRRVGSHRRQHGGQPRCADGHLVPQRPGQAPRGQPVGDQRLPRPHARDQGQLHAPHRLRRGPCAGRDAGHALVTWASASPSMWLAPTGRARCSCR
jgi:hypothetical protein